MNTFSLILVIACVITGIAYVYDRIKLRPARYLALQKALEEKPDLSKKEQRRILENGGPATQLGGLFYIVLIVFIFRAFFFEPFRIPSGSMEPTLLPGDFIAVQKWAYGIRNPLTNHVLIETGNPERGDIVVFKYPEDPSVDFIKRVVGMPGDEVTVQGKNVFIRKACSTKDDTPCESPTMIPTEPVGVTTEIGPTYQAQYEVLKEKLGDKEHLIQIDPRAPNFSEFYYRQDGLMRGTWKVPDNMYFVMGDNRDNSKDSRFWGFVPKDYLVGKTVGIWMSLEFNRKPDDWLPSFIPSAVRFNRIGGIK